MSRYVSATAVSVAMFPLMTSIVLPSLAASDGAASIT
jgi:hypothetical protein